MMHVESPMQIAEEKPPGNEEAALAINLVQIKRPESSALGMVRPVFSGVTHAFAARRHASNSCSSSLKSWSRRSPS